MSEYFMGNPDLYDSYAAETARDTAEVESWMYPYDDEDEDAEDDEI